METQFHTKLKILRSDNGGEYLASKFQNFLTTKSIEHQLTCPHTPAQNGVAERKHKHLIETTITLMHQSSPPIKFWFDALAASIFLINRHPTSKLNNITPFEVLFKHAPDYNFLKVFGCRCYPWLRSYITHKLQPRSIPCVFLGYQSSTKGYRCLDVSSGKVYISRHVLFDETIFSFQDLFLCASIPAPILPQLHIFFWPSVNPTSHSISLAPSSAIVPSVSSGTVSLSAAGPVPISITPASAGSPIPSSASPAKSTSSVAASPLPSSAAPSAPTTTSIPISSISIELPLSLPSQNHHSMLTRSKTKVVSTCFLASTDTSTEAIKPSTYKEAAQSSKWKTAMLDEFQALQKQATRSLVPLPPSKSAIGSKWVYRIKKNSDDTIARYKARLVAKGFLQTEEIDFHETFSPVAKQPTVRVLLTLALHFQWPIKQLDISIAFLHGVLEEEAYMHQPQGFIDVSSSHLVCKLHKSLYGLK